MNPIFVFGSNLAGIHGAGSAAEAHINHGAKWGVGEGLTGNAYAIPTKDRRIVTLPLVDVVQAVDRFKMFAADNKDLTFNVVKIGCGLAGFTEEQISPLFVNSPSNVNLPEGWKR